MTHALPEWHMDGSIEHRKREKYVFGHRFFQTWQLAMSALSALWALAIRNASLGVSLFDAKEHLPTACLNAMLEYAKGRFMSSS